MKTKKISTLVASIFLVGAYFNLTQAHFERGDGYWSSSKDENNVGFFNKLTEPTSQREDWYKVTPYVAEFWCTLSNAGFIIVGLSCQSPELIFAGVASVLMHSIPKQWLLVVDKIGVVVVLSKVIREREFILNNPWLLIPVGCAGCINLADVYLARNKSVTWPHVVWHLSAALLAYGFLTSKQTLNR